VATSHPPIAISRPWIGDEEKAAVLAVLESGMLAQGPRVAAFEDAFTRLTSPSSVRRGRVRKVGNLILRLRLPRA
jgi:dTDP-4-amino-4,6-dideoxygalactose transaminase